MIVSAAIILLSVALYGLVHSILASLRAKALARRWWGPQADRFYRLAYNLFGVLSLLPVLALVGLLPDRSLYRIPFPWLVLSLAGQLLAVVLLAVGLIHTGVWSFLGLQQLAGTPENPGGKLVVQGLYRWVRHPLYTAGLAFIWLTPVMTANLLALNLGLTAYIVVGARFEERKLVREFGEAYARYQATTPMLIPRIFKPSQRQA